MPTDCLRREYCKITFGGLDFSPQLCISQFTPNTNFSGSWRQCHSQAGLAPLLVSGQNLCLAAALNFITKGVVGEKMVLIQYYPSLNLLLPRPFQLNNLTF